MLKDAIAELQESDETLLARAGGGDSAAFERLFDRYAGRLFGLARQLLGDEREAEDVVQEAFVYMWDHAPSFDSTRAKAFTWAVMILRNKAIDCMRSRGRRQRLSERAVVEAPWLWEADSPTPEGEAVTSERGKAVRQAISNLPLEQRRMIESAFLKGQTHQQIAEGNGLPLGTVKTHIRRGLCRLRDILKDKLE